MFRFGLPDAFKDPGFGLLYRFAAFSQKCVNEFVLYLFIAGNNGAFQLLVAASFNADIFIPFYLNACCFLQNIV